MKAKTTRNKISYQWIVLTMAVVLAMLLSGCCEKPEVYRVGILSGLDFFADTADGFKARMTELGYVEGENITYDFQKTNLDPEVEQRILEKFIADEVDLIVVFPTEVALVAKAATQGTDIPVIFIHAFIEGADLVESVREPGGNITGVRYPGPDMAAKRLEILQKLVPQAKHILIPYQAGYPSVPAQMDTLDSPAEAAGITLIPLPADNPAAFEADLQARAQSVDIGFDAVLCLAEPLLTSPDTNAVLAKFTAERKIPIAGCPVWGGSYESIYTTRPDNVEAGELAASLADKVLKGTPAGTLPVMTPTVYMWFNYKAAQELGLTVPDSLLTQAVEIIR